MQLSTVVNQEPATAVDAAIPEATSDDGWKRAAQRALHPTTRAVGADVLAAIASGLAAVTLPWELGHDKVPTERRYKRVLSTEAYEAWVICWPVGDSLDLHDHGSSAGAFSVVSGELDEATVVGNDTVIHSYVSGETNSFGSSRVHAIANRSSTATTSVHVYSPPLSSTLYYEHDSDGQLVALTEDSASWNPDPLAG